MQPLRLVVVPYTYAEYAALPPDGRRWELIDGDGSTFRPCLEAAEPELP